MRVDFAVRIICCSFQFLLGAGEKLNRRQSGAAYNTGHRMLATGAFFVPRGGRERSRCSRLTTFLWTFAIVSSIAGWTYSDASATPPNARQRATAASKNWHQDAYLLPAAYAKSFQGGGNSQTPIPSFPLIACTDSAEAMRKAQWQVQRDQQMTAPGSGNMSDSPARDTRNSAVDLQSHMGKLQQAETELSDCLSSSGASTSPLRTAGDCSRSLLMNFEMSRNGQPIRDVPIWQQSENDGFFYEAGMTIDADGAPNAYNPQNTGIDDLANAGDPGYWEGLAKDKEGKPYIQGPNDPYPGYYVSTTALADRSKPFDDPARYVDATKIPFLVLPGNLARQLSARPGDFAAVFNLQNGKSSPAIFADVGPVDHIGEGSVALAENLGIRSDARNGGTRGRILYLVFPGSGNGRPRLLEEINAEAEKLFQAWGGILRLAACTGG
jgi:hypothetical protein